VTLRHNNSACLRLPGRGTSGVIANKAFTEAFYFKLTGAHLQPALDTLEYLVSETQVWTEITTLLIPGKNDSDAELQAECSWIREHLGVDVPLHFSAFHLDWKMCDVQG